MRVPVNGPKGPCTTLHEHLPCHTHRVGGESSTVHEGVRQIIKPDLVCVELSIGSLTGVPSAPIPLPRPPPAHELSPPPVAAISCHLVAHHVLSVPGETGPDQADTCPTPVSSPRSACGSLAVSACWARMNLPSRVAQDEMGDVFPPNADH